MLRAVRTSLVVGAFAASASACSCGERDVVAQVGSTRLHAQDLDLFRSSRAAEGDVLPALIERERVAEAARKAHLEREPAVKARLAAAEREVLAQAYVESRLGTGLDEAELRRRYETAKEKLGRREIHVAQVAIQNRFGEDPVNTQARANRIYAAAAGGGDFAELARKESDDRVSGAQGGDLGVLREGEVDPSFFAEASRLHLGELSKPFHTAFGIHVVKALAEPQVSVPTFDEARPTLAAEARRELETRMIDELKTTIPAADLRAKADGGRR